MIFLLTRQNCLKQYDKRSPKNPTCFEYESEWYDAEEFTCGEEGLQQTKCTICGDIVSEQTVLKKHEYEEEVISTLEGVYGELNDKSSLRTAIVSAAENGAEDNMGDYFRDLLDRKTGSFLDDLDEENLAVIFRETLAESVSYLIEKRLGEAHIADDFDFQWMYSFNTKETLEVLGHAVSDIVANTSGK